MLAFLKNSHVQNESLRDEDVEVDVWNTRRDEIKKEESRGKVEVTFMLDKKRKARLR